MIRSVRRVSSAWLDDGALNTTLPLWMYVRTSSKPASWKLAFKAGIGIKFFPPTLIPRSRATYRAIGDGSAAEPVRGVLRMVREDQVGAGTTDRRQQLEHDPALV